MAITIDLRTVSLKRVQADAGVCISLMAEYRAGPGAALRRSYMIYEITWYV